MYLIPITDQIAQQGPSSSTLFAIFLILYIVPVTIFIECVDAPRECKLMLWRIAMPPILLFFAGTWIVKQWIKSRKRRVKLERIEKKRVARKLKKRLLLDAKLTAELRRVGVI